MKKLLALLLAFVLVFSLAACGGEEETGTDGNTTGTEQGTETPDAGDTDTGSADGEKKTITIWAWDPNFNVDIMQKAADRYANDNVEINVVEMDKGGLEQTLLTTLSAGDTDNLPDIVLIEDYNAQKYVASFPDSFADLTGKIPHEDFAGYKVELATVDGKIYSVPFDSGVSGMFYRTDYLEQAGYTMDDVQNITWDEYIAIGEDVLAKTGHQMHGYDPNDGGLMRIMLNGAGSWYFDADGNVTIAGNEALAESLRVYRDLVNSDITKHTSGWDGWITPFQTGETASITTGVWIMGSVKAGEGQEGLWGVAPTPRLDVPGAVNASNLGGSSWYVLDSSDAKDEAIEFLKATYTDVEFYQEILVANGAVGSYLPAATGSAYSEADAFFGGQTVFADFSAWMDQIPSLNYGSYTYTADEAIMAQMQTVYEGGSIEDALEAAQAQVESLME